LTQKNAGKGRALAFVFVLAVGVDVHALCAPIIEAFSPFAELFWRVMFAAQTHVGKVGRQHIGRVSLVGIGQAKRGIVLAQDGVGFLLVPGVVTHFEREPERRRPESKEIFEQRLIKFEVALELYQNRTEVVTVIQHAGYFEKALERAFTVAQPLNVRDLLVRFQSETEAFGNALCPIDENRFGGHPVKTVIDLHGRELLGIKGEHFTVRQFFRIEVPLPLFVRVAGSADKEFTRAWNGGLPHSVIILAVASGEWREKKLKFENRSGNRKIEPLSVGPAPGRDKSQAAKAWASTRKNEKNPKNLRKAIFRHA